MKTFIAIAISTLTFGCMEAPPAVTRTATDALPVPFVIVGDTAAGMTAANELRADGLTVVTSLNGRAAGLTAFCTGNADAMALTPGQDWTDAERTRCRAIRTDGWSWSALSTEKGVGFYVRYEIAQTLLDAAPTAL